MIISLIASKGGTAKTTSAVFLACAAAKADPSLTVRVLDADPQRSATDWAEEARASGDALPVDVVPADVSVIGGLRDSGDTLSIIDTAPGFDGLTREIIARSDMCIVPSSPTPLDIRRAWKTVDACQGKAVVLVTKANRRTNIFRETMRSLGDDSVDFFDTVIRNSVAYSQAFGTNPRKLLDYTGVWQEIRKAVD